MELTCLPNISKSCKPDQYLDLDEKLIAAPALSLLSEIRRLERALGHQRNITLSAEDPEEVVRALRFHPRYEDFSEKELRQIVKNRTSSDLSIHLTLHEKLLPIFSAVIAVEGIGVEVTEQL